MPEPCLTLEELLNRFTVGGLGVDMHDTVFYLVQWPEVGLDGQLGILHGKCGIKGPISRAGLQNRKNGRTISIETLLRLLVQVQRVVNCCLADVWNTVGRNNLHEVLSPLRLAIAHFAGRYRRCTGSKRRGSTALVSGVH